MHSTARIAHLLVALNLESRFAVQLDHVEESKFPFHGAVWVHDVNGNEIAHHPSVQHIKHSGERRAILLEMAANASAAVAKTQEQSNSVLAPENEQHLDANNASAPANSNAANAQNTGSSSLDTYTNRRHAKKGGLDSNSNAGSDDGTASAVDATLNVDNENASASSRQSHGGVGDATASGLDNEFQRSDV